VALNTAYSELYDWSPGSIRVYFLGRSVVSKQGIFTFHPTTELETFASALPQAIGARVC